MTTTYGGSDCDTHADVLETIIFAQKKHEYALPFLSWSQKSCKCLAFQFPTSRWAEQFGQIRWDLP